MAGSRLHVHAGGSGKQPGRSDAAGEKDGSSDERGKDGGVQRDQLQQERDIPVHDHGERAVRSGGKETGGDHI